MGKVCFMGSFMCVDPVSDLDAYVSDLIFHTQAARQVIPGQKCVCLFLSEKKRYSRIMCVCVCVCVCTAALNSQMMKKVYPYNEGRYIFQNGILVYNYITP